MKKLNSKLFLILLLAAGFAVLTGCNKKAHSALKETKVDRLCDVQSDKNHLRVASFGESVNRGQAEKKALNNARTQMAAQLNTTVKSMVDNYTQSTGIKLDEEYNELFKSLQRDVINANFSYVTVCNQLTQRSDGKYVSYIGMELGSDEIWKNISERLPADDKLRIEYDYERFKKEFAEEMEKLGQ